MVLKTDKSDNELAVLAAGGNEQAFREILSRFRSKLIGISMRMLRNKTEAEEAAQDSFVKVYIHLSEFDPERNFAAWIAGITINECRDRLRKRSRFKKTFVETTDLISQSAAAPDKVDLENKARLDAVEEALEKLPDKLKEVLILKAYGDYSYDEIAESLGIKTGTVMSRLFRAREKLTELTDTGDR